MDLNDTEVSYIYEECSARDLSDRQVIEVMRKIIEFEGNYKFLKQFRILKIGPNPVPTSTGEIIIERLEDDPELSEYLE